MAAVKMLQPIIDWPIQIINATYWTRPRTITLPIDQTDRKWITYRIKNHWKENHPWTTSVKWHSRRIRSFNLGSSIILSSMSQKLKTHCAIMRCMTMRLILITILSNKMEKVIYNLIRIQIMFKVMGWLIILMALNVINFSIISIRSSRIHASLASHEFRKPIMTQLKLKVMTIHT